jgi:mRNA interferase HigB
MIVAALRTLRAFWENHAEAEEALRDWYKRVNKSTYTSFVDLKKAFPSADYVAPYTVFDIAGNHYRIIALVDYEGAFVKIRHVFTHSEYDLWNKKGKLDASQFTKPKTKQDKAKDKEKTNRKKARD